jgi:hypothetical protein
MTFFFKFKVWRLYTCTYLFEIKLKFRWIGGLKSRIVWYIRTMRPERISLVKEIFRVILTFFLLIFLIIFFVLMGFYLYIAFVWFRVFTDFLELLGRIILLLTPLAVYFICVYMCNVEFKKKHISWQLEHVGCFFFLFLFLISYWIQFWAPLLNHSYNFFLSWVNFRLQGGEKAQWAETVDIIGRFIIHKEWKISEEDIWAILRSIYKMSRNTKITNI